jgi:hypothetical protein
MVRLAQTRWPVTTREAASAVAGDEGAVDAQWHGALGAADVERFGVPAQDDGDHLAITGDAPGGGGADQLPIVQRRGAQPDQH